MNGQSDGSHGPSTSRCERVISAARDALTDEMVTRLATTAGDAVELMDQVNRAGLARAMPAVAQMVNNGDLERLSQIARLYSSAQDALTDEMVTRLSQAIGEGLALLDQVNRAGLDRAIPALAEMVNNGDLNRLVKLVRVYGSAEDALTDEMVSRLVDTVGNGLSLLDRFSRGGAETRRQDARRVAGKRGTRAAGDDAAATADRLRDRAGGPAVDRRRSDREPRGPTVGRRNRRALASDARSRRRRTRCASCSRSASSCGKVRWRAAASAARRHPDRRKLVFQAISPVILAIHLPLSAHGRSAVERR